MSTNVKTRKIIIETIKKAFDKKSNNDKTNQIKSKHKTKSRLAKNFSIYKVYYFPSAWEEYISHRPNREDLKQLCKLHGSELESIDDFEITKVDLMIRRTK